MRSIYEQKWSVRFDRHGLIGGPGYSLPAPDELEIFDFAALRAGAVCNLQLKGDQATGLALVHRGANLRNVLVVQAPPSAQDCRLIIGSDCSICGTIALSAPEQTAILASGVPRLAHGGNIHAQLWSPRNLLYMGAGSSTNGTRYDLAGEGSAIIVGDDCMFARNTAIASTDHHAVVDMADDGWRNPPADVVLEPHVWLGEGAAVAKGVVIGIGAAVGAHSFAVKAIPRFTIVGGVPARPIRSDVCWHRQAQPRPGETERIRALAEAVPPFAGSLRSIA